MTPPKKPLSPAAVARIADPVRRVLAVMALLRDPERGCPWDRKQTLASLKPYLVEETYEALDAIDSGDPDQLRGELGDVLLQILFQSQIASEAGWFDFAAVAQTLADKLVHRHPHVFGEKTAKNAEDVLSIWESAKQKEDSQRGLLDGIPNHMPALQKAHRMSQKAARAGFDWPDISGVLDKVHEEVRELAQATDREEQVHELGDILFAMANAARHLGLDPEEALQQANRRFRTRFSMVEQAARDRGRRLDEMTLDEMDQLWEEAKRSERGEP